MEPLFDFSEAARRVDIPPCGRKGCSGFGEFRNFRMHNGLPELVLLCRKHDELAAKENGEMEGEQITDLATLTELFKIMLGADAVEKASAPVIAAASTEPQESEERTAPILDFAPEEKPEPPKEEEKAQPTPGVYILEERPTENHYFCVEDAKTGEPCNEWFHNNHLIYHAKNVHGIERYQNRTLPKEDHECVRGDHKGAGCVMSFKSSGALSTHLARTKLKFPPKIPHPAPEPTPQQQPADADRVKAVESA